MLTAAQRTFDDADWEKVLRAFQGHRDPLTGQTPEALYDGLFRKIVNQAPAPIGLGSRA